MLPRSVLFLFFTGLPAALSAQLQGTIESRETQSSPPDMAIAAAGMRKLGALGKRPVALIMVGREGPTVRLAPDSKSAAVQGAVIVADGVDPAAGKAFPVFESTVIFNASDKKVHAGDLVLETGQCAKIEGISWAPMECDTKPEPLPEGAVTLRNVRTQNVLLSAKGLTFELVADFDKPQGLPLSNMIYVQVPARGSKYWISTHDFRSSEAEATGTLKCTITIPKFKPGKEKSVDVAIIVDKMVPGARYNPGQQIPNQQEIPVRDSDKVSNKATGTLVLP